MHSTPSRRSACLIAVLTVWAMAGCRHVGPTIDSIPVPEAGSLEGVTICLDPGHGGPWPGAVAPNNGLRECDVNLRVALELRTILENAGAHVAMTRVSDEAVDASSLGRDLTARTAIAEAADADVFVSIHHNADIRPRSGKNDLEVYYRQNDDAASLDLAQCLTQGLAKWLRTDADHKRLLPGNYRVLRSSRMPAVLLESAYMTHRPYARYMKTSSAAEAEARAIALGLASYFAMDPPKVAAASVETHNTLSSLEISFSRGAPIDLMSVRVRMDDAPVEGECLARGQGFAWAFRDPPANGPHTIDVSGRNQRGASFSHALDVSVARPAHSIVVNEHAVITDADSNTGVALLARVYDVLGLPVADGTRVVVNPSGVALETSGGAVRHLISLPERPVNVTLTAGSANSTCVIASDDASTRALRVLEKDTRAPIRGAVAIAAGECIATTDNEGWLLIPTDIENLLIVRRGYQPGEWALASGTHEIGLTSRADNVLSGRVIAVDAAYGGRTSGPTGPSGARACDLNRDIADRLACRLRDAGASVVVTRTGDSEWSELERVRRATKAGAEVFVSVSVGVSSGAARLLDDSGHAVDVDSAFVGHYPGSTNGKRLAVAITGALGRGCPIPCVAYTIQQTACPAVLVQPGSLASYADESGLLDADERQRIADAIVEGLIVWCAE